MATCEVHLTRMFTAYGASGRFGLAEQVAKAPELHAEIQRAASGQLSKRLEFWGRFALRYLVRPDP